LATILDVEPEHGNFALLARNVSPYAAVVPVLAEFCEPFRPEVVSEVNAAASGFDFVTCRGGHVCFARREFVPRPQLLATCAVAGGRRAGAQAPTGIRWQPREP
jgi:hypothetical protein